jgi:hypothetical protein
MVLIGVIIVGALIWFFAFSGVVLNRGGDGGTDININRNDNPPAQNNDTTNSNPNPVPS